MGPEERRALIQQMSSPDEEQRRQAMERIKENLAPEDLDWLIVPLSDESWRVRKEAIEGLSRIQPDEDLIGRLVLLMDPSRELSLRNSVVEVLERMGTLVAPLLVGHLGTGQADIRKFIVDILANIGDPSTLPDLLALLKDPGDNIRAASAEALAAIGDPSVSGDLIAAIEGSDDWVLFSILGSLAQLGSAEALPVFFRYLGDTILSKPAITGIGLLGTVGDGIKLVASIPGLTPGATKAAFTAAGEIYRRTAIGGELEKARELADAVSHAADEKIGEYLIDQLAVSEEIEAIRSLMAVLGMIGGSRSLQAVLALIENETLQPDLDLAIFSIARRDSALLPEMLTHNDPLVRRKSVQTLERLGNNESLPILFRMLHDESGHVRKDAARAVSVLGNSDSVKQLLPLLGDEYGDVAQSAANALITLGLKSPLEVDRLIRPLLESSDADGKVLVLKILMEIRAPGWLELCLASTRDEEPSVRTVAVKCLGISGEQSAAGTIVNCLADESPEVRVQAAMALEVVTSQDALEPLRSAIYDRDPWVRSAAVSSFGSQPGARPEDLREHLAGDDLMMKMSVVDALGKMASGGKEKALDILGDVSKSGSLELKRSVCGILGGIESPKALDLLLKAILDDDPGIRIFAVQALARKEDPAARKALADAAGSDPDRHVRETARSHLVTGQ